MNTALEGKFLKIYSTTLQIVLYVSSNQEKQRSIPYHALSPTPFIEHSEILNLSI